MGALFNPPAEPDPDPETTLTPQEIKRLKRMALADARAEWLLALLRRWILGLGAVAAFVVALRNDVFDLVNWVAEHLRR